MKKMAFMWISLVAISFLLAGASHSAIDPNTVAGLWLFDGDATDMSGNGNDGTLMGDPAWGSGKFGQAIELDGDDDYVDCGAADSLDMEAEVTVALWLKTDKEMLDMWADRQVVIGKHYLEYEIGIYLEGQIHTYTSDGAGGYDEGIMVSMADALGEADWAVGEWYHLAWTLDGTHETAYVNGVMIGEFDKGNENTAGGDHALEIGRRTEGGLPFMGAIDEVIVLSAVLGEADIVDIMSNGLQDAVLGSAAVSPTDALTTTWGKIKE